MLSTQELISPLQNLIEISPYFQRAISLEYDLGDPQFIDFFAPTNDSVEALLRVLAGTKQQSNDRSHVLIGAYGTGKSLLGLVLSALLNPTLEVVPALSRLADRLNQGGWNELASEVTARLSMVVKNSTRISNFIANPARVSDSNSETTGSRILPVVLSGNYPELSSALVRACQVAIEREELPHLKIPAVYQASVETIERWQTKWPLVYAQWEQTVEDRLGKTALAVKQELEQGLSETYLEFCQLYPLFTAGASFDPYGFNYSHRVTEWLTQLAMGLKEAGWDGFAIIWDEFGRFLEERASQPFGQDAQLLQELAERCSRSEAAQMHLVLITHKSLHQYGRGLAGGIDKEWSKIEGRFSLFEMASDPRTIYNLIERGLRPSDPTYRDRYIQEKITWFDQMLVETIESNLFSDVPENELRRLVVQGAYPLHPIAAYCLPRLSDRVAQNQRTLFTFLVGDDEYSLFEIWQAARNVAGLGVVVAGQLFDYFANGIRAATEPGGVHWLWSSVERAKNKLQEDEEHLLLVKTLAVLHVAGAYEGGAPSTELVAFAMGATSNEERRRVGEQLDKLASLRIIRMRKLYGGWEFVQWLNDFDIEQEVNTLLQVKPPTLETLRNLLNVVVPPPVFQARRYNDDRGMVRYFSARYSTVAELEADAQKKPNWISVLKEADYADGLVIYALPFTNEELVRAKIAAREISRETRRVLCVVPLTPLALLGPLEDLYALSQVKHDLLLLNSEGEAVKELEFLEEDSKTRLEMSLAHLVDPRHVATWFCDSVELTEVSSPGAVSRLLSEICFLEFQATPKVYNENFNKRNPSTVQLSAAEKVIDAILSDQPEVNFGLTGHGPDLVIFNSALKATGIVDEQGRIGAPDKTRFLQMALVWEKITQFYKIEAKSKEVSFEILLEELQSPPFGLRRGILPLLLAVTFKEFAATAVIKRGEMSVSLVGKTFTEIVYHPSLYKVQVEQVDEKTLRLLQDLEERISPFIRYEERKEQQLRYLSLGLLRWFQNLPRFSRDTNSVSKAAISLRRLIRLGTTDPHRSLLVDLPRLVSDINELNELLEELENTFEGLIEGVGLKIGATFGLHNSNSIETITNKDLITAISNWYQNTTKDFAVLHLFSDPIAEELAKIGREPQKYQEDLISRLTKKVVGSEPRDWNDELARRFDEKLLASRERLEKEVNLLQQKEKSAAFVSNAELTSINHLSGQADEASQLVELGFKMPGETEEKRFSFSQSSKLSVHGHQLAESLRRTIDISGRSLDIQEKRAIALELLRYILEGNA